MDRPFPRPRKRFGQNFLHDAAVIERIAAALDVSPDSPVLEIGPGRGALTRALLERTDRVWAVEIDRDLAAHLREEFSGSGLSVIEQDVLQLDFDALGRKEHGRAVRWTVAGNLPYNISKPLALRLVESVRSIESAVLMFQREVARRLCAAPGGSDYGPLSVLPRAVYEIEPVMDVRPGAFRPRPDVVSTVTRWVVRADPPSVSELHRLRAVLGVAFANRRKTLKNNLSRALGTDEPLQRSGIDGSRRAQELTPEEFHALARYWVS
ncbi:MAG: ribosomal RNA small subunit methyltransferase A [Acidobacteria bacterium]|nr:ribosomal RNA small subunit methyltransferase A [Acidobacteriota bacterium]NIM60636.1 ribosomal RNA small subunit methyltransferase A [Acidobacteriota bacterium]NIO57923.1 ribosomal RNA small subunit methyltransferase A [Acidobacteriota bacterium]NIQ28926.1 ribosomal RNA small subunit methyltransferase A [Acidobacteriota bacterium]NIQ83400.1 ribosomal RNA small subunit methyltransferase A [Acidobacteriota bacterium]